MDNLLMIAFEAHHAEKNHHSSYEITVGQDLFNEFTVSIRYGRIGQRGQERRYSSPQPAALRTIIRQHLRRRLSAPKRIGCPYRLATFSTAAGFNAAEWLPGDLMARFFVSQGHSCEVAARNNQRYVRPNDR